MTRSPAPSSHDLPAPASTRGAIDSIVQGALVELFSAYAIALAPLPRLAKEMVSEIPGVSVNLGFKCEPRNDAGKLTLSLSNALLEYMKDGETASIKLDWARELANQLLGRIKNRLLPFGLRLQIGVSTLLDPRQLHERLQGPLDLRVYAGRTVHGPVLVTIQGLPDDASLRYVGTTSAAEGTLIWL